MDENNFNQQPSGQYTPQSEPQNTQSGQYADPSQQFYANQPQQPVYNQPPVQQPFYPPYDPTTQVMSVGQYVGMFILSAIPIVNIICWIVWLCSSNTNKNKKNYIKASIILWIIGLVIWLIILAILTATGASLGSYY